MIQTEQKEIPHNGFAPLQDNTGIKQPEALYQHQQITSAHYALKPLEQLDILQIITAQTQQHRLHVAQETFSAQKNKDTFQ